MGITATFNQSFEDIGIMSDGDRKSAGDKLDQLIKEKMKAKPDIDYGAAFTEVQLEYPELTQEYVQELL
jgi:ABC-type Fe3+ transport system substrate-binding protein